MRCTVALCLLVACGHGGGGRAGADADAAVDTVGANDASMPLDTGDPKPVTVTFSLPPTPNAGVDVLFLRPDGALVCAEVTNAAGRAQCVLDETGMVVIHFLPGGGTQHAVWAYLSVPPGSDIYFGAPAYESPTSLIVNGPAYPGATSYRAKTECAESGPVATPSVALAMQYCHAQTYVLWTALVGSEEFVSFTPAVDVHAGSVTLDAGAHPFHPAAQPTTITVTSLPPDINAQFDLYYHLATPSGQRIVESDDYLLGATSAQVTVDRPALADEPDVLGYAWVEVVQAGGAMQFYGWVNHDSAPVYDLAGRAIPWVSQPTFDALTGTLSWSEHGDGAADITVGTVYAPNDPVERYWTMIAPHGGTQEQLPRLPPPYDYLNIEPATETVQNLQLQAHNGGYARFLADYHGTNVATYGVPGDIAVISYSFGISP